MTGLFFLKSYNTYLYSENKCSRQNKYNVTVPITSDSTTYRLSLKLTSIFLIPTKILYYNR